MSCPLPRKTRKKQATVIESDGLATQVSHPPVVLPPAELAAKTREVFSAIAAQQQAVQPKPAKQIAVVGKAPSSCSLAPYDQPNWEIWGLSDLYKVIPRWTRYFELHDPEPRKKKWGEYWKWLQLEHRDEAGNLKPIYMQRHYDEIPNSVPYPKDAVIEKLGDYFTNSISWMIALAILEGATELGLWGVDMAQQAVGVKSEYAHQRPSCEYFLGVAAGLGINVFVHPKSDLMKAWKLYAFDSDPDEFQLKILARKEELQAQLNECNRIANEKQQRSLVLAGALDNMSWIEEWISASPERRHELLGPLKELLKG